MKFPLIWFFLNTFNFPTDLMSKRANSKDKLIYKNKMFDISSSMIFLTPIFSLLTWWARGQILKINWYIKIKCLKFPLIWIYMIFLTLFNFPTDLMSQRANGDRVLGEAASDVHSEEEINFPLAYAPDTHAEACQATALLTVR